MKEIIWTFENKKSKIRYNHGEEQAKLCENEGVPFFTFPSLLETQIVKHGFSTKLGGVSKGEWESMNLSYSRGDDPECVDENYRRICKALQIKTENVVLSDQVHDTVVMRVGKKECQGASLREKMLQGIDGLVTSESEVALCTSYADCVPLFFVDTKNKAIGSSHSGWRGTVGKIGAKTVETMKQEFGSKPEELKVVIGPSICQSCYEVSKDVFDAFEDFVDVRKISKLQQMPEEKVSEWVDAVFEEKPEEKYQLDLWLANKLILMEAGVKEEKIAVSCVCTCCNHELLFSHRYTKGKRGNLNGFIALN
ncbi:MAG: peptidoglycan editing factor PgeF [Lachnospiraceae bacterium]|nr:peptidoglycan editing factor PgeF [Lachnospiraceae bacterium]